MKVYVYDVCVFMFTIFLNLIKTVLINVVKDKLFYQSLSFLYLLIIFLYTDAHINALNKMLIFLWTVVRTGIHRLYNLLVASLIPIKIVDESSTDYIS